MEQKLDQVKEDYKQFWKCKEDPYLSSLWPAPLVQQAEKHTDLVDVFVAELLAVFGGPGLESTNKWFKEP